MLREITVEDYDQIEKLIQKVDSGYEIDSVDEILKHANKVFVFDDDGIKGFTYATLSGNGHEKRADVKLYVEPQARKYGIGTKLYRELLPFLKEEGVGLASAYTRVDQLNPEGFCEKLGFEKWWGSTELYYDGALVKAPDIKFIPYEDRFFKQYVKMVQDCFYPIHKANDLKPYLPTEDTVEKFQLKNRNNVYLTIKNEQVIAGVTIEGDMIDFLMVSPMFQGKGYGKKALQFGMNKLMEQGTKEIRVVYMDGNANAQNLYQSFGFKHVQTTRVYRCQL
jgi:ribosomal protein S18 acetylase RimI-like enzyme